MILDGVLNQFKFILVSVLIIIYPFTAGSDIPFIVTFYILVSLLVICLHLDAKISYNSVSIIYLNVILTVVLFIIYRNSSILSYSLAASLMLLTKSLDIQHDSKLKYVFLVSLVLASFTWQSTSNEGRYAILNGDPNYTSVIMFTLIISMGSFFQKKRFRILVYILLFFLFYLTLSRMLMLMVLIYFVVRCFKSNFIVNSLGVLIFLSTMLTQLFVFLFLYSSLGQGGDGFIISNLNDGSNMERVKAFKIAYEYFVYDLNTILFGNSDYLLGIKKGYFLQVHNGFFGMLVYFGVIFTTLFYVVLFWFFIKADDDLKPVIYSLTLASGILGPWVFGTSMVLILLSYKQSDTRRLELK